MIRQAASRSAPAQTTEDVPSELDDPFIGLLGGIPTRDDLWLGKSVPRYTSYPPATSFQDGLTAQDYEQVLATLSPEEPLSLYLHVPYCKALCLYCGCHTTPTQKHERVSSYLDSMHRELENIALSASRPRRISHLHFGGGSPNMMSEKDMGLMFGALARRFDLSSCREIAIELDPRLVTKAQARTMGMIGVSRVSLGVQDFDPEVQKAIGREQPYEMVANVCSTLRENGIGKINFDLMYGLPLQSPSSVAETARKAIRLKPDRISLFSYAHVPQVKKHQKVLEQYILPGPHAALALEKSARRVLLEAGYVAIGMDHFALPGDSLAKATGEGRLHRNFQGYTDDAAGTLLGVGASSIGKTQSGFFQNARDIEDYQNRIRLHGFATTRGLRLTGEDRFRAAIIETLMCTMRADLELLCRQHHYSPAAVTSALEKLQPFVDAGIVRCEGYRLALATPNRMAIRAIAACFDTTIRDENAPVSKVM